MGTNNFYNHENGLFIIEHRDFDEVKAYLIEESEDEEEITDENVYSEIDFCFEIDVSDTINNIKYDLESKGYSVSKNNDYSYDVYNKSNKIVASLEVRGGYYSGAQIIVETEPCELFMDDMELYYDERKQDYSDEIVQARLNEVYTPYSATLFNIIKKYTTSLNCLGVFSSGEAIYSKI